MIENWSDIIRRLRQTGIALLICGDTSPGVTHKYQTFFGPPGTNERPLAIEDTQEDHPIGR